MTGQPTAAPYTPPARFVSFLHGVQATSVRALIDTVTRILHKERPKSLGLLISTPGGDVNEGVLLFNTLRALPVELTTYNIGNVDSIGNVIFLAGSHRVASPSATFMFHGVAWNVATPQGLDYKQATEIVHVLDVLTTRIKTIIAGCTSLTMQDLDQLFLQASTKDAGYAKAQGFIHEIGDPVIPRADALTHSPEKPG